MTGPRPTPKVGDVLYVRARPGLPNGVRSRAGSVFNDREDTKVLVVAPGEQAARQGRVDVAGAKLILEDTSLVVGDEPAVDSLAAARAEIARLAGELRDADALLEKSNAANRELAAAASSRDSEIAVLRKQVATLDEAIAVLRADAARAAASGTADGPTEPHTKHPTKK